MKLQPASEMSRIAEENYEKFKQGILESEEFETLKFGIKEAANEGQKTLLFNVHPTCDPRTMDFLKSVLIEAGYGVHGVLMDTHSMRITW